MGTGTYQEVRMRHRLPAAALCTVLTLISCQQKQEHTGPKAIVADATSAIVIVADLPVFKLAGGALTASRETIPIGEKLSIVGPSQRITQSGREREFLNVKRDSGSDGWVRADQVVSRAILAVITTDNSVIYSAEANSAATTESIPRMTIVAIHSESGGMPFIRVTCYDPAAKAMLRNVALRNEGVSAKPSDVQAAILLQLAAVSRSPKQQKAFLTAAMKDYPDSVFLPDLQSALDELSAPPAPAPAPTPPATPTPTAPGSTQPGASAPAAPAAAPASGSSQ
jgi:hypothetical protein